jgi:hypothetical protein
MKIGLSTVAMVGGKEQGVRITGTNSVTLTDLLRDNNFKISMTKPQPGYLSTVLVVNSPYDKTFIVLTVKTSPFSDATTEEPLFFYAF